MNATSNAALQQRAVIATWIETARDDAMLDAYAGKRSVLRCDWICPMELFVAGRVHFVYSFNITQLAMGVTGRVELRPGTVVGVRRDDSEPWVQAKVVHVTESLAGFKVGLMFLS